MYPDYRSGLEFAVNKTIEAFRDTHKDFLNGSYQQVGTALLWPVKAWLTVPRGSDCEIQTTDVEMYLNNQETKRKAGSIAIKSAATLGSLPLAVELAMALTHSTNY